MLMKISGMSYLKYRTASKMIWDDVGSLYWLIRRGDLAAGRFDLARFTLRMG
jgi:Domain of unknown function (DUF1963)